MQISDDVHARNFFNMLQRHFLAIRITFRKGREGRRAVLSAFLMSVSDEWVLITAGHCIDDIQKLVSDGFKIVDFELIDGLGTDSPYKHPIPMNYEDAHPVSVYEEGFDCGVLRLNANQRQLLTANRKTPLTEEVWLKQPDRVDLHLLVGIPSELTREDEKVTYLVPSIHFVTEVERDEPFKEMPFPMFYGKVHIGDDLKSIAGMSGGPIFSFREKNGEWRYWLSALQSGWNRSDRRIAAPRTQQVGLMIAYVMERAGSASLMNSEQRGGA